MEKSIVVHTQDHLHIIEERNILYCKSDNCYTCIHLKSGEKIMISKSLSKFSKELTLDCFIRVSQSYLVDKHSIKRIDKKKKQLELPNDLRIQFTTTLKELLYLIGHNIVASYILLITI